MSTIFCCVPYCRSREANHLTFHAFPTTGCSSVRVVDKFRRQLLVDRREVWIKTLRIRGLVSKSTKVCSLHFKESDYFVKGEVIPKRRILKSTAIPSVRLPGHCARGLKAKSTGIDIYEQELRLKRKLIRACTLNGGQNTVVRNIVYIKQRHTQDDFLREDIKDDPLMSDTYKTETKQDTCSNGDTLKETNIDLFTRDVHLDREQTVDQIPEEIHRCQICLKTFSSHRGLVKHNSVHMEICSTFECIRCGYKCADVLSLTSHIKEKHGLLNEEKCKHCGEVFYYDPKLGGSADDNSCEFCSTKGNASETRQEPPESTSSNFLCNCCPFTCSNKTPLIQHLSDQHGIVSPHVCGQCKKIVAGRVEFDKHVRTHTLKNLMSCEFCPYQSLSESDFKTHTARKHRIVYDGKKVKIEEEALAERRKATQQLPCKTCGGVFSNNGALAMHMKVHTHLYRCVRCRYKCETKVRLQAHIEIKHNMRVSIDECDNYNVTLNKNNNSAWFHCDICQLQCTGIPNLIDHYKTTHNQHYDLIEMQNHEVAPGLPDKNRSKVKTVPMDTKTIQVSRQSYNGAFTAKVRKQVMRAKADTYYVQLTYNCSLCDANFSSKDAMAKHFVSHRMLGFLICSYCKFRSWSLKNLEEHSWKIHNKQTNFKQIS